MGNQTSSVQSDLNNKHLGDDKCTSSSDSHPNFQDLQDFQTESFQDNKFVQFLGQGFKEKKIASKQIQFKIIDQNNITKKKPILEEHSFTSNLEETQQFLNQKSNFYSQMEDMNSMISQHSYFSANDKSYQFFMSLGDKISQKQDLMTRSSFSSYDSKYKQLNIKQSKFVRVRNLKFQDFYENLQQIGQGATGRVFTARCKMTNQIRAVKVLKNKIMKRMRSKHTLHSELDMLKNFDHPNIIKVYDVFHTQDLYYVVTEYCSGGTLQQYVDSHKNIDEKFIKIIFRQLLSALCYLHSISVIHRDIKLDNIVFKTNPKQCQNLEDVQIKIIDFGLAKKAKYKALNKDSPCLGTPLYMAPQIMKGHYSQKCDIWACGVILHYLLFSIFPFQSAQVQFLYKKISTEQIDFTKNYWKKIPKDARILLQSMLQKNGARRINACDALKSQWFQDSIKNKGTKTQKDLIYQKLMSYKKENNFITIIESYILFAKTSRDAGHQKLIQLFHKFDQNNNGCIETDELQQILKQNLFLNNSNGKYEIRQMIAKIDKNNSGKIEISEFLSLFIDRNELFSKECLQNAFDFFDQDKDGSIDRLELSKMLEGCDDQQFQDMWRDLDTNIDNKITKAEFIRYLKRLNDQDMQQSSTKSIMVRQQ